MNIEIIAWVGFAQSLFAAVLMFTKKDRRASDTILAFWLLLFSFEFLTCALDYRVFGYLLLSSSFLLFNPAIFIYIRSLIQKEFKIKWIYLLHLIPFLLFEIIAYIYKTPFSFENFFEIDPSFIYRISFSIATILSALTYLPLSIRLLHKYRMQLMNEKSSIEKGESLTWLYLVSIIYIIYSIVAVILGFVFVFLGYGTDVITYYNYSFLLAIIYIISFYGLYQNQIEVKTDKDEDKLTETYKHSLLNNETKSIIKEKIIHYIENEKAYLNPDLNMDLLSEAIGFPKYQITEVLNTEIGYNFFRFINHYRVEAVKNMLLQLKLTYSVEAIGYDCGFNSKSSFYTVFKKITGKTPTAFRQDNLK